MLLIPGLVETILGLVGTETVTNIPGDRVYVLNCNVKNQKCDICASSKIDQCQCYRPRES